MHYLDIVDNEEVRFAFEMKTFIDGSKNQRVGVSLKRYKVQPYMLKLHILSMDVKELPLDKVSGLLKCMPDEEDKELIDAEFETDEGDVSSWASVELFMYVMTTIPHPKERN